MPGAASLTRLPPTNSTGAGSPQLVQQRPRLFQVGRVEAFGEPARNWREEVVGFGAAAPFTQQARKADRGTQFKPACALLVCDGKRPAEIALDFCPFWRW